MSNKLFMETGGIAGLTTGDFNVYGSGGIETVQVSGTAFLSIDQNVEVVEFTGAASDYLFSLSGNVVTVTTLDGTPVAEVAVSSVATSLRFADGAADLGIDFAAQAVTLGGAPISSEPGTVDPALDPADASSIAEVDPDRGSVFDLTSGADSFDEDSVSDEESPIEGNVFNAPLAPAFDGTEAIQTLQTFDSIEGTDARDELYADLNGAGADTAATITGVEAYFLEAKDAATLDLSDAEGYEELWNSDSRADLELDNVAETAVIGLDGVRGGTTYTVNYTNSVATDTQNVIAQNVGTPDLATSATTLNVTSEIGDGFGTLNLDVSGPVDMVLAGDAASMETFNISGSGPLTLNSTDLGDLEVFNSVGYTDDLSFDLSGSADLHDVQTGDGNDVITVDGNAARGNLAVDLAGGEDILALDNVTGEGDVSALDFEAGLTGVENIAFLDGVTLVDDAVLDLAGVNDDLGAVWFANGINGGGNQLGLANSPVTALNLIVDNPLNDTTSPDMTDLEIAAGNVTDLDILAESTDSNIDVDQIGGAALETLDLVAGNDAYLDVTSDDTNDVSALQSVSVTAGGDSDVDIDADNADADMSTLAAVQVIAGADADLEMDGFEGEQAFASGTSEFVVNGGFNETFIWGVQNGNANDKQVELVFEDGNNVTLDLPDGDSDQATTVTQIVNALQAAADPRIADVTSTGNAITIEWVDDEATNLIGVNFSQGAPVGTDPTATLSNDIAEVPAVPASGFEGLETVVVDAADEADVNLDEVFGAFTLQVSANGTANADDEVFGSQDTVDVDLSNTGVVSATIDGGSEFDYVRDVDGVVTGLDDIDFTSVSINDDGVENGLAPYGNPNLTTLDVGGAAVDVYLSGDLSSFSTLDLTDATNWFDVDSSGAEFELDGGEFVTYLIGSTASEWGGSTVSGGDSLITMNADGRETVTFTEDTFGTVVLDGFTAGTDPLPTDRIDLSELGFTDQGQLVFEIGDYTDGNGEWAADAGGDDVRIADLDGGIADFAGEIIVTGVDVNDLQSNILYA
ncbi:beta strand repeat-containing protein [Rhodovulum adriaticum]|uniref:Uncharacterized protein n=1 Tax=Rhodovulum adriaticum TaxID=35804 RepID=A0A4R2NFM8_RHOAD|nr:hypothetical protein [Rhodovulum adriaticum]MBK1637245.1 hypothetical protein [Rhodovulum adriaticum]TCP19998.1 hypothetical protein EV656_12310 [Rhodovulum adriaticum]